MMCRPMIGDVDAAADPYEIVFKNVIEEPCEAGSPARSANQTVMQSHRHHLRLSFTLSVKGVEGILHVAEIVIRCRKTAVVIETIVIRLVGIRNNEVPSAQAADS